MSNQRSPTQRPRTRKDRNQTSSQYSNNGHDISFTQPINSSSSQDRRADCCGVPASNAFTFGGLVAFFGVLVGVDYAATGGATTAALIAVDPSTLATHCRDCCDATSHILDGGAQHFGSRATEVISPMQSFAKDIIGGLNQLFSTTPSTDDTIAALGTASAVASVRPARNCAAESLTSVTDYIFPSSSTSENTTPANSPSLQSFLGFLGFECTTREK